jgi:class 3 adenylate cyclase
VADAAQTGYATTPDGVHIAYQVGVGNALDLLVCPDAFFGFEQLRVDPGWVTFFDGLATFSRVVLYDRRGVGLSDPVALEQPPTLEQWADDALVVLDALGSTRAALLGVAEGCLVATMMAATHPERVTALVLVHPTPGRFAFGENGLFQETTPVFEENLDAVWNGELPEEAIAAFAPSKQGDPRYREWLLGALRHSLSPATARAVFHVNFWSNIEPVLHAINVPTLVLHRVGNRYVPSDYSEHVAASIPRATFVALPGEDHIVNGADQQALLGEIEEFLTGTRHEPEPDRILSTVMFTDIVDSTAHLAAMGDARWRTVLDQHDVLVDGALERYRGRKVNPSGDGLLATFDGPARAVRCACAIRDGMSVLGIEVRAGVHTGEVEVRGDDIAGVAVHTGARVAAIAHGGEVLVTRTVTDLVAGSGLTFSDRGEHELKGLPGTWHIYAVADPT